MEFDHAQLHPEFDAVCAWTSRDRVIVMRMTTCLARGRQNACVEMEELEKNILSPIEIDDLIGVLALRPCDHEGRRIFVAAKRNQTTLVTNVSRYAVKRAKQDEEYQELHEDIEYMNERQGKLLSMMERKQKLKSAALEYLWRKILQEMMVLDERISADGIDLLEKKQVLKELLKETIQLLLGLGVP